MTHRDHVQVLNSTVDCYIQLVYVLQVKAGMRTLIPIEQKYIEEEPRVSKQVTDINKTLIKSISTQVVDSSIFRLVFSLSLALSPCLFLLFWRC